MGEIDLDLIVGANVQRFRTARGMSQAELAAAISTERERIPQQTILRIEKGKRQLKFAEAVQICKVLRVSLDDLGHPDGRAAIRNADYFSRFTRIGELQSELSAFASRLMRELVGLAYVINFDEAVETDPDLKASDYMVEAARGWLGQDWGKELNRMLKTAIRSDVRLAELRPDLDAPTYAEVLEKLTCTPRADLPTVVEHGPADYYGPNA